MKTDKISVAVFFALSYALAWSVWIPLGQYAPQHYFLVLLGAFAPTIAALLLTAFRSGRVGIRNLLSKCVLWRVPFNRYLFAVFGFLVIVLIAIGVNHLFFDGPWITSLELSRRFGLPEETPLLFYVYAPLIFLTTFIGGPIAEELGWRGYAQPHLQKWLHPGIAGAVIGLVWSLWHLPLFLFFPRAVAELPLGHYIPIVTALGVLFSWLYNRSKGSVLLSIVFHAGINFAFGVFTASLDPNDTAQLHILVVVVGLAAFFLGSKTKKHRG
jgi:hypothetical protein